MNPALRLNSVFAAVFTGGKRDLFVSYGSDKIVIEDAETKSTVSMNADAGVTFSKEGTDGDIVLKPGAWTFTVYEGDVQNVVAAPAKAMSKEAKKQDTPRKVGSSTPASGPYRKAD